MRAPARVSAASVAPVREATPAPSKKPRLNTLRAVGTQSQSVNTPAGNSDGDAATDGFKDGVIHAVRLEVFSFRKAGGMVKFDERRGGKGVVKAVNNPLGMWRNRDMGCPYLPQVTPQRSCYPRYAGPV